MLLAYNPKYLRTVLQPAQVMSEAAGARVVKPCGSAAKAEERSVKRRRARASARVED
jgi:hypothetical protein